MAPDLTLLNFIDHPGPGETPLVIAHGLYGSAHNWNVIAKRLSLHRRVITVDMRNHGQSFHDPSHDYFDLASDLGEVIGRLGGRADLLGHSMGGKAAMMLALTDPGKLRHLIVADIAPVAYTHDQRRYVQAMRDVPLEGLTRRSDAEAALKARVEDPALVAFFFAIAFGVD